MDDDADEIVGEAAYRVTEAEFIAAYRAARIARNRLYDSWLAWLCLVALGHLLLIPGALLFFSFLVLAVGKGDVRWGVGWFAVVSAAAGSWLVDAWLYGSRRRYRKLLRAHPLAGLDVERTFTADRLHTHAENMDAATDWPLFARIVELRDGFLLEIQPLNTAWVP